MALGIKKGDEVITTLFIFLNGRNYHYFGCHSRFIDIDPKTYNITPNILPAITKKTKAIIAVSLYGQPATSPR